MNNPAGHPAGHPAGLFGRVQSLYACIYVSLLMSVTRVSMHPKNIISVKLPKICSSTITSLGSEYSPTGRGQMTLPDWSLEETDRRR